MSEVSIFWFVVNLVSIVILAFYSMLEMACVSFNKVRLQYYVSKGYKRAEWLNFLLQNPSRLFGTTLIGVNIALVVGSECSRQLYSSIGLNPDLSPLTQVLLVVIFGELAPMFAARHYAEHVAMLGMPLIYFSAKIMTPLLWCVDLVSKMCNYLVGGKETESNIYLNQEELQKILEEHSDELGSDTDSAEFSAIATNIFRIRGKHLRQVMEPMDVLAALPVNATIQQAESLLLKTNADYIPLYNNEITNIVGIAYPRDMLRATETQKVRDYLHPPWFVPENGNIMQILKQFRTNNESVAIVLNSQGRAIGVLDLSDVLDEVFGEISYAPKPSMARQQKKLMLIGKTFPGSMTVGEFNTQFDVLLDQDPTLTLSDLFVRDIGANPEKGESIYISPFELTVKETSLTDVKTVSVSTRM